MNDRHRQRRCVNAAGNSPGREREGVLVAETGIGRRRSGGWGEAAPRWRLGDDGAAGGGSIAKARANVGVHEACK